MSCKEQQNQYDWALVESCGGGDEDRQEGDALGQGHTCVVMPLACHMKGLINSINVVPSSGAELSATPTVASNSTWTHYS